MGKIIAAIVILLALAGVVWALVWVARPIQVEQNLPDSTQAEEGSIFLDTSSANETTSTN